MMSPSAFSDEELVQIKSITYELKEKIEYAFSRPPDDTRIAEIKALRASLEERGFMVTWRVELDLLTYAVVAEVTIWRPKRANDKSN